MRQAARSYSPIVVLERSLFSERYCFVEESDQNDVFEFGAVEVKNMF